ncbi:pantothenate kinase 4, partial [Aureobasidium melanogenum]
MNDRPPPLKRRRVSSSAEDMQHSIVDPGTIKINVSGAYIIDNGEAQSPASDSSVEEQGYEHDRRDIRLPNHTSVVSHVAADIGGSLAKVVYFSREPGAKEPGGRLHFLRFETEKIDTCIEFMRELQKKQRRANGGKQSELCVMATGGGAFKYYDRIKERLGVDVMREDEMECLIQGLDFFITEIPNEVFTYHDEDQDNLIHYTDARADVYPYLLVNIGSGVSMIKVEGPSKFQRIGGTSLGGGTLWGLLSLLTGARTFDDMLAMADAGDNSTVDLLVGDIYGQGMGYDKIGLSERTIASSFGKVFKRKREAEQNAEDGQLQHEDGPGGYDTATPEGAAKQQ